MLGAVDEDGVRGLVELVDDPELAAPSRVQPLQLAAEGFPGARRVIGDRTQDGLDHGSPDLGREAIQVPEAFRRDLDFERHRLELILEFEALAGRGLLAGTAERS